MLVGHQPCDPQHTTTHQAKRGSGNGRPKPDTTPGRGWVSHTNGHSQHTPHPLAISPPESKIEDFSVVHKVFGQVTACGCCGTVPKTEGARGLSALTLSQCSRRRGT